MKEIRNYEKDNCTVEDENKKNYYNTGEFANMASVTQRTIRYYDKIGLLKPSFISTNGYRKYSDKDFFKLQKIIALKQLGFSIEEIYPLVLNERGDNLKASLVLQSDLIKKRIAQLESLKNSLNNAIVSLQDGTFTWQRIIDITKMMSRDNDLVEQYKNAANLNIRIQLHEQYSINKIGWFKWLYEMIDFSAINKLLEIGCGNGNLWANNRIDLRNREIFLSDISYGMVDEVKKRFGRDYNCLTLDCMSIPFKDNYFDAVVANHVLFYVDDLSIGLSEIHRVMKEGGILYCSTYGHDHMKEITQLVQEFDPRIRLSNQLLYDAFGLENGGEQLKPYFHNIEKKMYPDKLIVNKIEPLIDYIMSCHGNQTEILSKRIGEFENFVSNKMKKKGYLEITKNAGVFIARK
ncbi:MAG: methyltransferase domain-containing protein [Erysipelotrichaceae bacterium]|nr:methyltransferase domain-containing protein [Erysipelotrichaceae bacterium]